MPSHRVPGSARSRAAASAVTFEIVPPLVNAPAAAGKPTNSLTHRTAWSSTWDAAPAHTARLTSKHDASRSPSTPISSPDEPTKAKKRGRGWAIDMSSSCAASSSAASALDPFSGKRRAEQLVEPLVDVRLAGPRAVEALPGAGHDRGGALERLLARRVEAERRELGSGTHRRELVPEQTSGPHAAVAARRRRAPRRALPCRRGRLGSRPRLPTPPRPRPSRPPRTSAARCPSTSTEAVRALRRRPRSRRRRARLCRSPCPSAETGSARTARASTTTRSPTAYTLSSPGTRSASSTSSGRAASATSSPGGRRGRPPVAASTRSAASEPPL